MKDGVSMSSHLNEFNSIFNQLSGQGIQLNDSLEALFLLITLLNSLETLLTTISTNATADSLFFVMVESSLFIKEVNRKNVDTTRR